MNEPIEFHPYSEALRPQLENLLDLCFGPARLTRTAALLRRGAERIDQASFRAMCEGTLVGSVECWTLSWNGGRHSRPIAMLGPLAAHPERRAAKIGSRLMDLATAALDRLQLPAMLIGDEPYYGRWGFSHRHTGGWRLPGPVEANRLLLRAGQPERFAVAATLATTPPAANPATNPTARPAA